MCRISFKNGISPIFLKHDLQLSVCFKILICFVIPMYYFSNQVNFELFRDLRCPSTILSGIKWISFPNKSKEFESNKP
jgi:hypothetical protein